MVFCEMAIDMVESFGISFKALRFHRDDLVTKAAPILALALGADLLRFAQLICHVAVSNMMPVLEVA
jgi:hypothetical protein